MKVGEYYSVQLRSRKVLERMAPFQIMLCPNLSKFSLHTLLTSVVILLVYRKRIEDSDSEYINIDANIQKRFPTTIIIGAQKCGTTALLNFLSYHPSVACNTYKEAHYFDNYDNSRDYSYRSYLRYVPFSRPDQITIEKTPKYFRLQNIPLLMYNYQKFIQKRLKFILIVRNPIKRAISHVYHTERHKRIKVENLSAMLTEPANFFVKGSHYGQFLQNWMKVFNRNQFLIINGDSFGKENPVSVLRNVENFLEIPSYFKAENFFLNRMKGFYCYRYKYSCILSAAKGHKTFAQNLTPDAEKIIATSLKKDVQLFEKLSNQTFNWF